MEVAVIVIALGFECRFLGLGEFVLLGGDFGQTNAREQEGDDHDHDHDHAADKDDHAHGHHADLAVTYTFTCKQPAAIDTLKVTAFGNWPRLKHIDAAVVNDQGQQAQRLEAGKAVIRWKAS